MNRTKNQYVNLYKVAFKGFTVELCIQAAFYYALAVLCNLVDVHILTVIVSDVTDTKIKQDIIPWYILNNLLCIWVKYKIEYVVKVVTDNMNKCMEEDMLLEFQKCTMESQDKNIYDFKMLSDNARRTVAVLAVYVPIIIYTSMQTLGDLIYGFIFFGAQIILITPLLLFAIFAWIFAKQFVPRIVNKYKLVSVNAEKLRPRIKYMNSALIDLCLHNRESQAVKNIVEANHIVETLWSDASIYGYILTQGIAWAIINIIAVCTIYCVLGSGDFVYATWKLYQDIQTLFHSGLRYYGDYMRNIRHVYDFDIFRKKYVISRREQVAQHIKVESIVIRHLKFIRHTTNESVFTLLMQSPPIVIDMNVTRLVLITGKNGEGKTTFGKIITGEIESLEALDLVVNGSTEPDGFLSLRNYRTAVTQFDNIDIRGVSWYNYITDFAPVTIATTERVLKLLSIVRLSKLLEFQYRGNPHELIDTLSGGERRKASISRALFRCTTPQILFLDEPDAGVDSDFPFIINDIKRMHPGGTIFLTLMNLSYIDYLNIDNRIEFKNGSFTMIPNV